MFPALAAWLEDEEEEEARRQVASTIILGILENREHTRAIRKETRLYLTRPDLLPDPRSNTPWTALYERREPRAFIMTMGFDPPTFDYLLEAFEPIWNTTPIPRADVSRSGAPRLTARSLDAAGASGLVLHYLNSTMKEKTLSQIFALIPTTVSRYLDFALEILQRTLKDLPEGKVSYPEEVREFEALAERVQRRHPLLENIFGSLDGLKVPVGVADDPEVENANYNGWLHSHFVSSIFMFSSEGRDTIFQYRLL